ncbi:MAG TPA: hypothetical protein VHK06_06970, partial [Candidatus Limnocylindria bacterium]|nr:hypothetical protein [Candidatus Limnocylindria bacterium]
MKLAEHARRSLRGVTPLFAAFGAFGAFGILFGVWQVLLPDLTRDLRLSPGPLGAMLSLGFIASLPAMLAAGRVADRVGRGCWPSHRAAPSRWRSRASPRPATPPRSRCS